MTTGRAGLIVALALPLGACANGASEADADLVLMGGAIHTMDGAGSSAAGGGDVVSALCVTGARITYAGDDTGAAGCAGPGTTRIDLQGRLVLPGLIDSHMHAFMGAFTDTGVNLSKADTAEEFRAALEELKARSPSEGVIYAMGWQHHLFDALGPRAAMLDEVFGDRPVILFSVDLHSTVFNTTAFRAAGVTADVADPEPGVRFFERDAETGQLLGTARESARMSIVRRLIKRDRVENRQAILDWLPRAAEAGLTGLFDAGMGAGREEDTYSLLAELEKEGALTLRMFTSAWHRARVGGDRPAARLLDYRNRYRSELIQPTAVKLFADGNPESHTAYLARDYKDRPGHRSQPKMEPERLNALVADAAGKGVPVHVHAIGGAAIAMALDAVEAVRAEHGDKGLRHTIAHMDFVSRPHMLRFAALGVVAQTSIQWATRDPSYAHIGAFVGEDAMEAAYPVKSLIGAGVVQTFGSDWPASAYLSTFKPMDMIEVAVTRQLPGRPDMPVRNIAERLTVAEAVWGMTRASAYQMGREADLGSLEVGKRADLVVLDNNIFTAEPQTIHTTRSLMTIVNGQVVWKDLSAAQ